MMMSMPCISILRHDVGSYEWELAFAGETLDCEVGEASITDCLKAAAASLAPTAKHVEVKYRGVHMGTFILDELAEHADAVADRISESYAALF